MDPDERCPYGPPETLETWIARLVGEDVHAAITQDRGPIQRFESAPAWWVEAAAEAAATLN